MQETKEPCIKGASNAIEILELKGFGAESLDASAVEGLVKDLVAHADKEFSYEAEFWDHPNPILEKWNNRKQRGVVDATSFQRRDVEHIGERRR